MIENSIYTEFLTAPDMDQEAASAAVREGVQLAVGFRARISACRYQALIGLGQTTGWAGGHDLEFLHG